MGIKYLNFEELICAPANSAIAQSGVRLALRISLPRITRALYKPAMIIINIETCKLCRFLIIYILNVISDSSK